MILEFGEHHRSVSHGTVLPIYNFGHEWRVCILVKLCINYSKLCSLRKKLEIIEIMDRPKGPGIRRSMSFSHGNLIKHVRNISKLRRNINFDRINISCGLIINYYSRSLWSIISLSTKNPTAAPTRGDADQVRTNLEIITTSLVHSHWSRSPYAIKNQRGASKIPP